MRQTTVVEHRSSEVLSTQLTDNGTVYYAFSVHHHRAKLIARSTIDVPWRNFLSPEFRKSSRGSTVIFVDTVSLKYSVGLVERSLYVKRQINPSVHFEGTPTCDRHTATDRRGHTVTASTRASIASRG